MPEYKFDITKLKNGDNILFHYRGFSWVSMAIRELTQSYWNHVGKFYWEGENGVIIEALFKGVKITPIEDYIDFPNKYDLKAVRLKLEAFKDEAEYKLGMDTARIRMYNSIGKKYDFGAIVWLGIFYIWKNYYKKSKQYIGKTLGLNPLENRDKFFCSETVCKADYGISSKFPYFYQGKTKADCSTTTPKDTGWHNVDFITGKDIL